MTSPPDASRDSIRGGATKSIISTTSPGAARQVSSPKTATTVAAQVWKWRNRRPSQEAERAPASTAPGATGST